MKGEAKERQRRTKGEDKAKTKRRQGEDKAKARRRQGEDKATACRKASSYRRFLVKLDLGGCPRLSLFGGDHDAS